MFVAKGKEPIEGEIEDMREWNTSGRSDKGMGKARLRERNSEVKRKLRKFTKTQESRKVNSSAEISSTNTMADLWKITFYT